MNKSVHETQRFMETQDSNWGCTEVCPHCMAVNEYPQYNPMESGWILICRECGQEIFLCDACLHSEDNPTRKCDWCEETHTCFRGTTKHL